MPEQLIAVLAGVGTVAVAGRPHAGRARQAASRPLAPACNTSPSQVLADPGPRPPMR